MLIKNLKLPRLSLPVRCACIACPVARPIRRRSHTSSANDYTRTFRSVGVRMAHAVQQPGTQGRNTMEQRLAETQTLEDLAILIQPCMESLDGGLLEADAHRSVWTQLAHTTIHCCINSTKDGAKLSAEQISSVTAAVQLLLTSLPHALLPCQTLADITATLRLYVGQWSGSRQPLSETQRAALHGRLVQVHSSTSSSNSMTDFTDLERLVNVYQRAKGLNLGPIPMVWQAWAAEQPGIDPVRREQLQQALAKLRWKNNSADRGTASAAEQTGDQAGAAVGSSRSVATDGASARASAGHKPVAGATHRADGSREAGVAPVQRPSVIGDATADYTAYAAAERAVESATSLRELGAALPECQQALGATQSPQDFRKLWHRVAEVARSVTASPAEAADNQHHLDAIASFLLQHVAAAITWSQTPAQLARILRHYHSFWSGSRLPFGEPQRQALALKLADPYFLRELTNPTTAEKLAQALLKAGKLQIRIGTIPDSFLQRLLAVRGLDDLLKEQFERGILQHNRLEMKRQRKPLQGSGIPARASDDGGDGQDGNVSRAQGNPSGAPIQGNTRERAWQG